MFLQLPEPFGGPPVDTRLSALQSVPIVAWGPRCGDPVVGGLFVLFHPWRGDPLPGWAHLFYPWRSHPLARRAYSFYPWCADPVAGRTYLFYPWCGHPVTGPYLFHPWHGDRWCRASSHPLLLQKALLQILQFEPQKLQMVYQMANDQKSQFS